MFNLTRQERQVLLFVAGVVLTGIIISCLRKINPPSKVLLPQIQPSITDKKVNPNKASLEELIRLPEIGPVLAQNILEYRNAHGPFNSLEDLGKVKGLGPKKLERLKDYLDLDTRRVSEEEDKSPY